MQETQELIRDLEQELKKDSPRLQYIKKEIFRKGFKEAIGESLRVMGPFYSYILMEANIAYSEEHADLNSIILFSKLNDEAKALFEKTKEFYYKNKISYEFC